MEEQRLLVLQCLANDTAAQKSLYRQYSPLMYGLCQRFAGNDDDAGEILQLAFIKVFLKLYQFRFESDLGGWIRKVVVTTATNFIRSNETALVMVDLEQAEETAIHFETGESFMLAKELVGLMQCLPALYRMVLNLHLLEGYSHREIAEMLGISDSQSRVCLVRAKQKFYMLYHQEAHSDTNHEQARVE